MGTGTLIGFALGVSAVGAFLSAWAHFAQRNRALAVAIYVVFGGFSLLLIGIGLLVFMAPTTTTTQNPTALGWSIVAIGLALGLPLLPPFRLLLAKVTPLDPQSKPDMMGLSILAAVVVATAAVPYFGNGTSPVQPVATAELVVQDVTFVLLAFLAVGALMTRDLRSSVARLGLRWPTPRQVGIALGCVAIVFVLSSMAGVLTHYLQPGLEREIEQRMQGLLQPVTNWGDAVLLGLSTGIGEETLFRGAVQPRYGIVLTSLAFAVVHTQYGFSFVTLAVFGIGIVLGLERQRMNTTTSIVTHAVWNIIALGLNVG